MNITIRDKVTDFLEKLFILFEIIYIWKYHHIDQKMKH